MSLIFIFALAWVVGLGLTAGIGTAIISYCYLKDLIDWLTKPTPAEIKGEEGKKEDGDV